MQFKFKNESLVNYFKFKQQKESNFPVFLYGTC